MSEGKGGYLAKRSSVGIFEVDVRCDYILDGVKTSGGVQEGFAGTDRRGSNGRVEC